MHGRTRGRVRELQSADAVSVSEKIGRQHVRNVATRALHHIQQFILCLANADREGRVLLTAEVDKKSASAASTRVTLKYLLLAPADAFRDVAEDAKAVVLAGGTMAPVRCPLTTSPLEREA